MSLVEPPDPAPDRGAQAQPLPPADTRIVVELSNRWIAVPAAIDVENPEVGKSSPWSFGSPDIFCRDTTLATVGLETLLAGATVDCETEQGLRGPEVLRIRAVDFSTSSLRPGPPAGPRAERARPAAPAASDSGRRVRGLVKWFMPMKGYGFLEPEDGSPYVFCHVGAVEASGRDTLPQDAVVTCDFVQGDRGAQVSRIFEVETPAVEPRQPAGARLFDFLHPGPYAGAQPAADMELPGTVKFYDPARGFGFVVPDAGGREVFVHASVLLRSGLADLQQGQRVLVRPESVPRGLQATEKEPI